MKAICDCKARSENALVVAVQDGRFDWITRWTAVDWIVNLIGFVVLPFVWAGAIFGWNAKSMFYPKHHCASCKAVVEEDQLRA